MIASLGFRARLLAAMLVVIVGLHAATSYVVLARAERQGEARAVAELDAGRRVFERLFEDREQRLLSTVGVLVTDFGLRRAVATKDAATVASALANHGRRVGASLAFLLDVDGDLVAVDPAQASLDTDTERLDRVVAEARNAGAASGVVFLRGQLQQIVLVPVKAPITVGWVGMGFELDVDLASELQGLTGLHVSFWSRRSPNGSVRLSSTLPLPDRKALAARLEHDEFDSRAAGSENFEALGWFAQAVELGGGSDGSFGAVLQTSYAAAMAPVVEQRRELVSFFAAAVALALASSLAVARRVTRPVSMLAKAVEAVSAGDVRAEIDLPESRDEFGALARTFRIMQETVADREERILHESLHDRLTRLPNRAAVENELDRRLSGDEAFSVLHIDVAQLKDINGTFGATIGDELLVRSAERLAATAGITWLGRVGGDEFLAITEARDAVALEEVTRAACEQLEAPHEIRDVQVSVGVRVGTASVPADGQAVDEVMRRAEMALGLAKQSPSGIAAYLPGLEEANQRRIGIAIELERALEEGQLELHYQPKLDLVSARVVGVEALIRWTHPVMGRMNPEEFIGIAEQTGFIGNVSRWVLEVACRRIAQWSANGIDLVVSINLSAHDAGEPDLPERIAEVLRESGASPERLTIEVTESAIMNHPEQAADVLARVRDMGVGVSIDDFGTGHSSLAQLRTLPVDELKIDQAFVRNLREASADEAIIRATVELGHSLGLKVVAEGVEDRISWKILQRNGCDVAQGYWMGRPMPEDEFSIWLDRFEKEGLDA